MAYPPFDLAEPAQLDASGMPIDGVQAPIPEPVPPMVPPPDQSGVLGALQGAPLPQDNAGALQWPDPAWLSPEGTAQPPVDMPGSPPEQAGPPADLQGPPVGLAGSPPAPPPTLAEQVPIGATAAQEQKPAGYLGELDAIDEEHRKASLMASQADIDQNNFNSSEGVKNAQNAAARQTAADDAFMKANDEAKTKRAELDNEAKAIAEQKIDPRRAWHDASFGAKLAFGIAVYLQGAITASSKSASGSTGPGLMGMLNDMCEQDMAAQEKMLANRTGALTMRRGLLADDIAAGRDMADFQYKSITAAYTMAENQIKAYAMKYNNPRITAMAIEHGADIRAAKADLANKFHNKSVEQWLATRAANQADRALDIQAQNANTARAAEEKKGTENTTAQGRLDLETEKYQRGRVIRGSDGRTIGKAQTDKEADSANTVLDSQKTLAILYKEGRELFKNDYALPRSELRDRQTTWAHNWSEARRHASGDNSAPNREDNKNWGVEADRIFGNNLTIIDEGYKTARDTGLGILKRSGIKDDELTKEGMIDPPEPPTPGVTQKVLYQDDNGEVNSEGRGTPLSPEETKAEEKRRSDFERTNTKLAPDVWKRRRYENNLHVQQRAEGALPWPDIGTGPID